MYPTQRSGYQHHALITTLAIIFLTSMVCFNDAQGSKFSEFGGSGRILLSEAGTIMLEVLAEQQNFNVTVIGEGIDAAAFEIDKRAIALNHSGNSIGLIEVHIPKELLGGNFTVFADDNKIEHSITESGSYTVLLFDIEADPEIIIIQGTSVVPEFPTAMLVLLLSIILVALLGTKNRSWNTRSSSL